jgi:hypothetical protein
MLLLFIVSLVGLQAATSPAQFVWEGEVDGTVVLHARANRLKVDTVSGQPVEKQRFKFYERLPDSRRQVRLKVVENRGAVWISQQPTLQNDYTLSVTIEDRQDGKAFYSIRLYWDKRVP